MSGDKSEHLEMCDECGEMRALVDYRPNQKAHIRVCAECLDDFSTIRSQAAHGTAGRPKKSPSKIEATVLKVLLSASHADALVRRWTRLGHAGDGLSKIAKRALVAEAKAELRREKRRKSE